MLGFKLDLWDYLTFAVIVALIGAFLAVAVFVLGLSGRIAIARKHPDADAINIMGWLGFSGRRAVDAGVYVGVQDHEGEEAAGLCDVPATAFKGAGPKWCGSGGGCAEVASPDGCIEASVKEATAEAERARLKYQSQWGE